jgi:hypothetical protein
MGRESVFPGEEIPTIEEAIALGREELYRRLGEAQRRQDNIRRIYGKSLQGRAHYLDYCLTEDRALIMRALKEIERRRESAET